MEQSKGRDAFKLVLKVRLILYDKGRILLLKQRRSNGGNFTLVGGKVEQIEFAKEALVRETMEEAGVRLREKDLILAHVLHKKGPNRQRITLYFKASKWEGKLRAAEPDKFKKVAWVHLESLPTNLTNTVRHVLDQYRHGRMYSELDQ